MELEAIRSRVREALRMRARSGRVAGGRCYGYRLERVADGPGRFFTTALIDDAQAEIVRRIFARRCEGWGLAKIAHELNNDGVPAPRAGRRGTGSWSPSCIRRCPEPALPGRTSTVKKVRRAGVVSRVASPSEVITIELPGVADHRRRH
jgi:DNA invertase Pin-like site-specific DNA recombinase